MFEYDSGPRAQGKHLQRRGTICLFGALGIYALSSRNPNVALWSVDPLDASTSLYYAAYLAEILLTLLGGLLLYRGKQYDALATRELEASLDRPPVVYLRPFGEDSTIWSYVRMAAVMPFRRSWWAANTGMLLPHTMGLDFANFEESLADAVAPLGPLLAIGQPGEALPKLGALHAYADDGSWRNMVDHWLGSARLVIVRPGSTPGVRWEVERAFTTVSPKKLIVLMLKCKRRPYEEFRRLTSECFGIAMPEFATTSKWRHVSGIFLFDDGWNPGFVSLHGRSFHDVINSVAARLEKEVTGPAALTAGRAGAYLRTITQATPELLRTSYASFWRRAIAQLLDAAATVFLILVVFVIWALGHSLLFGRSAAPGDGAILFLLSSALFVDWVSQVPLICSKHRGSLGMKVMGILVTDLRGNRLSVARATARHFGKILSCSVGFMGFWVQPFTKSKQTLHDMITASVVLKRPESRTRNEIDGDAAERTCEPLRCQERFASRA
jgi:uncharacterized RDD family membrane protein YckC